jgi:hypothetical protein
MTLRRHQAWVIVAKHWKADILMQTTVMYMTEPRMGCLFTSKERNWSSKALVVHHKCESGVESQKQHRSGEPTEGMNEETSVRAHL